jgi:membrane protease YdiL (CAAX protease family)
LSAAVLKDRDRTVGWTVGVVTLLLLGLYGAEGDARWPWMGFNLLAAAGFLLFLVPDAQEWAREKVRAHPGLALHVPMALALFGMVAALASGGRNWLNYLMWPLCVGIAAAAAGGVGEREGGRDREEEVAGGRLLLSGVALWVLGGIWERGLQIRVPGGTHLSLAYLVALDVALFLYVASRRLRTFDVRLGLRLRELGLALGAVAALAAAAIPLGFAIGFLHIDPRWQGFPYACGRLFGLTLFVGLPEEMLFRGVLQESFSRIWTPRIGLIVGAVIFGLSHLPKHAPPLNWPYALLATLAGLAYGWVYQRTGKLSAAAVTHGAVDWIWSTYLGA